MASKPSPLVPAPASAAPKAEIAKDGSVGPSGSDSGPIRTTVTITVTYS